MTLYAYNSTHEALLQDDNGLKGVILSLSSLQSLLFPHKTISSLIAESKQQTPHLFVLCLIYELRAHLGLPFQHLQDSIQDLEGYANDIYNHCRHLDNAIRVAPIFSQTDTIPVILASLKQQRVDLGPIDWSQVTTTEFAIMTGVFVGATKCYPYPRHASIRMVAIGTAAVRGMYKQFPPIPIPNVSMVYPHQPAQPYATQQPTKLNVGSTRNCPDPGSDTDVEDHSPCDIQRNSQGELDADDSPPCGRVTVAPACSSGGGSLPPASRVLTSQSNILQQIQSRQVTKGISNQISELHISEGDLEALNRDVPDAEV
jgi:hypothetical protein